LNEIAKLYDGNYYRATKPQVTGSRSDDSAQSECVIRMAVAKLTVARVALVAVSSEVEKSLVFENTIWRCFCVIL